jgi:soluble lytic murein transglycosylase
LVYGLSRQESEFDPAVVSSAGARGLMQLMPATARRVARQISVPYSPRRLTSDPAYNAMLGSAHLGDLIDGYTGSYVMSVAAYNAGATHVGEWVSQFGDPRSTAVDPVDWIENIPFTETRNYVQRVMENLEVYRSRLSGSPQRVRLADDIRRNTGAPIATAAPTPGKIPLASPFNPSDAMAPIGDADDKGEDKLADAVDPKAVPVPIDVPKSMTMTPRTPLSPGHSGH